MRWGIAFQKLLLLLDRLTAEYNFGAHGLHEFGHTVKFSFNLVGKLAIVAQYECLARLWLFWEALKDSQDKDSCLSHTRYGLAENVYTEN